MSTDTNTQWDRGRLLVLGLLLTFGATVIVAKLFLYQVVLHKQLKETAEELRSTETEVSLPRGRIADINGNLLALNGVQWDISLSPTYVTSQTLPAVLSGLLDMPQEEIRLAANANAPWVRLKRSVPQEVGERIAALNARGVICETRPLRVYPMGPLVSHVLGFVNDEGKGYYGLEGYYNIALQGASGKMQAEKGGDGAEIPQYRRFKSQPEKGDNLILTLDVNVQHMAYQELERALDRYRADSGTVIVMHPKTGALMAVVSLPAYDPNEFAATDVSLMQDPAVSSQWEPGSIFKIITWAAGLSSGIITPATEVYDEGEMEVGGRVIENSDRKSHGLVTVTDALVYSLNTVAAYISTSMGKDLFYEYLDRFGFGSLTNVDLASEVTGVVKLPGSAEWFPSELGTNSFGQGIAVTPMQMITAAAAVANQGQLMQPHIVHQFVSDAEQTKRIEVTTVEPKAIGQVIPTEAADALTQMLVEVVEHEAEDARIPGYRIAGKTGTAQIPTAVGYDPKNTIVSFVGYAPADDPQFIILVKLDKPKTSRWAATTAAPTFRAIAERLIPYLRIPPDEMRLAYQ